MRNIRQIQIKARPTTHMDSTLQNFQGHDKQGKPEKLSKTGETRDVMTKCHVGSWMCSWNRRRTLVEKLMKFKYDWSFVGSTAPMLTPSVQFSNSVMSDWDPVDCSKPGFLVHHQLLKLAQTHVHWVSDAIQPFHPLLSPSPPAFNLSQQSLFQQVSSLHQVAKVFKASASASVLPMNIQDCLL